LQFHIPPLRDRKDDIPALVMEFVTRAATEYGKVIDGVSRHALHLLVEHNWPGNIRELENEIRRAVLVCPSGGILQSDHLGTVRWNVERQRPNATPAVTAEPAAAPSEAPAAPASENGASLRERIEAIERNEIERALAEAGGNQSRAARILGITRNGLALKLKRLGVTFSRKTR
jgi:DNA-binding NtrC family response regulator